MKGAISEHELSDSFLGGHGTIFFINRARDQSPWLPTGDTSQARIQGGGGQGEKTRGPKTTHTEKKDQNRTTTKQDTG